MTQPQTDSRPAVAAMRVDIQWLRALAVGLVVLYHFWPKRVPGGFVGVDIFFVISGFLITSHLLAKPPTSWSGVVDFWGRRVRRLLPAAFLVILVTVAAVVLVLPMTQWLANGQAALASGLYVENWNLALTSVDYLAQDQAPTALQHFWSLSVEEQFYFIWPILFALVSWLTIRRAKSVYRRAMAFTIGTVFVASFGWSVYLTSVNPAQAYFVTPTRMWELAAGGCVALAYPLLSAAFQARPVVQVGLVGLGGAAMLGTAIFLTAAEPFPGWVALIPVAGAALVMLVGPADYRFSFDRVLKLRPFQFVGDTSYSIYLWHWPVVVLVPAIVDRPMNWTEKLVGIAVVVVLSWASKTFVEDKLRGSRPLGVPLRRTFVFLVVGMLMTSAAGLGIGGYAEWRRTQEAAATEQALKDAVCLGAAALLDPSCQSKPVHGEKLLVSPLEAAKDRNSAYADDCWWSRSDPQRFPNCEYGATDPQAVEVALLGNSHAGPWLTPLQSIASKNNLRLRTYLASECFPATKPLRFDDPAVIEACSEFTTKSIQQIKQRGTRLVVWSARTASRPLLNVSTTESDAVLVAMHAQMLREFAAAGIAVLVIRDVPMSPDNVTDCVAQNIDSLSVCDGPRKSRILPDQLYQAASSMNDPLIQTADFTDGICDQTTCYDVVGGLVVYFNQGHLSRTFADTFTAFLQPKVLAALSHR